jgi:hypothetical protein
MATQQEYAQLSLYVYNVTGLDNNRPNLPSTDWTVLEYHPDDSIGFSYGIFKNQTTGEVVVSYTGTNEKQVADFLLANLPAGLGLSSLQVNAAARIAASVIDTYGASNVTFTGHSLGGGLASIMGVWFDRPTTVFDPAPFEATARNPLAVISAKNWISLMTGLSNTALNNFEVLGNFALRESAVTSYYTSEEALQLFRMFLPTVTGTENRVEFGVENMLTRRIDLHSQALLTAGLMSESFRASTIAVQRSIPLVMDGNLYAYDAASSNQRNFLIDLIRSDQASPTNGKLTHFASDLNKLGTNISGLTTKAQDALIAQGIEWYYWQGTDYAGQEFFTKTGDLLQFTTAAGDALPGALNKASSYTLPWLNALYQSHTGLANSFPPFGTLHDQWNVAAGAAGVTATARNTNKSQIFIGGAGGDIFTAGNAGDVMLAGDGADTLNGGTGNDQLYGGAGTDTYQFSGAWGTDTILDSDGQGLIQIGGVTLQGGKKIAGQNNVWHNEEQGFTFALAGSGASQMLIITQDGNLNTIRVQGWQSGQLGLTMDDAPAAAPAITHTFTGDQRAKLIGIETQLNVAPDQAAYNSYAWNETSWAADGSLTNGIAEADFSDVVYGTAGNDKISGSATLNVFQRSKPGDSWSPPAGQRIHRNTSKVSSKYGGYSHISCSKNITPTRHTPNLAAASARAIRNGALQ